MFSPPWLMEGPPDSSTTRCLSGPAESARDVGTPGIALGWLWLAGWGPLRGSGALPWGCWLRAECAVDRIPSHLLPQDKNKLTQTSEAGGTEDSWQGQLQPSPVLPESRGRGGSATRGPTASALLLQCLLTKTVLLPVPCP